MNCPRCANVELDAVRLGEVEVDQCGHCDGLWFDRGEVGSYLRFSKDVPDIASLEREARDCGRACPRCGTGLKERPYVPESSLMVDYCAGCAGVWLDGGELGELEGLSRDPENRKLRLMRAVWELREKAGISRSMRCPKCRKDTLNELNTGEGVTVDFCKDCRGVWFQRGELGRMVELSKDVPDIQASLAGARSLDIQCPRCSSTLKEITYSDKHHLLVDYCPKCEGIWLDAGELSTVEGLSTILEAPHTRFLRALKELHDEGYVLAGVA